MRTFREFLVPLFIVVTTLTGCAGGAYGDRPNSVTLPLHRAWFEGDVVYYITTDVSEQAIAQKMGANLVPRLRDGVPDYPKPPQQKSAIEKVYDFTNSAQDKVFSSAPAPIGPASRDRHYSPLWLAILVTWKADHPMQTLKSEEEILAAADKGDVTLTRTDILLNCPIVGSARGDRLPNVIVNPPSQ